jgi:Gas vesicle synthesis protein GvpL/GvpF
MSEVYVHGVVAAADATGTTEPARRIEHRDLAALVSDVGDGAAKATDALRTHWRVLEAVGADTTVLPVRFGTAMADEQAVIDAFLAPGYDGLSGALAELAGKVQLAVRGFYDEAALMRGIVEGSSEIAGLQARVRSLPEAASYYDRIRLGELVAAALDQARERDTALVLARLEPLALATSRESAGSIDAAFNLGFLVERARMDEFGRVVGELGHELADRVQLRFVGPLPPYSFAPEDATRGATAWA